jgi:hypothetical protein
MTSLVTSTANNKAPDEGNVLNKHGPSPLYKALTPESKNLIMYCI